MKLKVETDHKGSRADTSSVSWGDRAEFQEVMLIAPNLRGLTPQHLDALLRTALIERFTAQHLIGTEGTESQSLHLVLKGEVAVFLGHSLREVVSIISRGGMFGGNLLIGAPNLFSFAAERDTLVASWSDETLRRAEAAAPGLRRQLSIRVSKDTRLPELSDILQHAPLLRNTSSVLRYRLLHETTLMHYPSGELLYEEGAPANCCYLVVGGEVALTRATPTGERETIALLGRGALFGEIDLLTSGSRTESAEAMLQTEVLAIDRMDVEALLRACGAFRYAIAARIGSGKPRSKPQDVIIVVNDTPYSTRALAALIRSSLSAIEEKRVALLEVVPEGVGGADGDALLQIPKDPSLALAALDERVRQLTARYVILFTTIDNSIEWLAEPMWDKTIDHRVSAAVYFTRDLRSSFPIETPQLAPVQYVELRPSNKKVEVYTVRSGSIHIEVDEAPSAELRFEGLSTACRTALQRLARTLTRQSVGVALGGGGAWGYGHVALLRGLVAAGIPIDMISGASMGAIIACIFASRGLDGIADLANTGKEASLRFLMAPFTRKPVDTYGRRLMAHENLEDLPLPTFPVALDIQTGRARTFRHGSAIKAALASSAMPAAFAPEILDGVRYLDGGMVNNVPVSCLVEEGADFIIASNVVPSPSLLTREVHKTPLTHFLSQVSPLLRFRDTLRALYLLMRDAGTRQATAAHITFTPSLGQFNLTDFAGAKKIIEAADQDMPQFIELAKEKYKAFCRNRDY